MATMRLWLSICLGFGLLVWTGPRASRACPFCAATSPTICEELAPAEVVAVGRLLPAVKLASLPAAAESPKSAARYEILEFWRGKELATGTLMIELADAAEDTPGSVRLLTACGAPKLTWSELHRVTPRSREYAKRAVALSAEGGERLAFFHDYLEDYDPQIAQDAYNEFANAPYAEVKKLRERMNAERLLARAIDPKTPAGRRGLLFTMLGICGGKREAEALEGLVRRGSKANPGYFDALLAAHLSLKGERALDDIDEWFLTNIGRQDLADSSPASLADGHAAIRALRFHLEEQHGVPKERLLKSLRRLLDQHELASVVIADLARWEDWQALPRLVRLFEEAESDASGLRVQVVNYLLACPVPEAARELERLARLAPKDVERAKILGVYGRGGAPAPPE